MCGQHKSPKDVLRPYAVKTLNRNTEIIKALNKFGFGMTYTQLEENDTTLCLQKLAPGLNERVALSASIKSHVFTTLAWENIDRIEKTVMQGNVHRIVSTESLYNLKSLVLIHRPMIYRALTS